MLTTNRKNIQEYLYKNESLTNYIYESINNISINNITEQFQTNGSNKNGMFLHKNGLRQSEDFNFNQGEKALCIAYDTDGYRIQIRGMVEIAKVLKSSIKVKATTDDGTEFYNKMKFDKTGIAIVKTNSKYRGKSVKYYVLYNKDLIDSEKDGKDIKEILDKGTCSWGFDLVPNEKFRNEDIKNLKSILKNLSK